MEKPTFAVDSLYHIYNRGVEKRTIFLENGDYFRFIYNLYEFNDETPAENLYYKRFALQSYEIESHKSKRKRSKLVNIIAFCLMPNHFHFLLEQVAENGIVKFMHKLGIGYSMYFNKKYERVGGLFQGRFKAVLLADDAHFFYLPHYIHLNPLELFIPNLKEKEKKINIEKALEFLKNYRWSSYLDFIGKKNFPSVLAKDRLHSLYDIGAPYKRSLQEWLNNFESDALDLDTIMLD